jgi:hypothetical protein
MLKDALGRSAGAADTICARYLSTQRIIGRKPFMNILISSKARHFHLRAGWRGSHARHHRRFTRAGNYFFVVDGALVYLDKPANGTMAAFEDGFSALEQSRKFFRETGLDVGQLDLRIR